MGIGSSARRVSPSTATSEAAHADALRVRSLACVSSLCQYGETVNVVVCGPLHVGVNALCTLLREQTSDAFELCDIASLVEASEQDDATRHLSRAFRHTLAGARKLRASRMFDDSSSADSRTALAHTCELADDLARPHLEALLDAAHHDARAQRPRFRIYNSCALVRFSASVGASHQLGNIDDACYASMRILAELAWCSQNQVHRPTHTLYVYLGHTDEQFLAAYDAATKRPVPLVATARKPPSGSDEEEESGSDEPVDGTPQPAEVDLAERRRRHALATKKLMDAMFRIERDDFVAKYFTLVLDYEAIVNGSIVHGAYACGEILAAVEYLVAEDVWGASDAARLAYLAGPRWSGRRMSRIPRHLIIAAPSSSPPLSAGGGGGSSESTLQRFQEGSPPLPRMAAAAAVASSKHRDGDSDGDSANATVDLEPPAPPPPKPRRVLWPGIDISSQE